MLTHAPESLPQTYLLSTMRWSTISLFSSLTVVSPGNGHESLTFTPAATDSLITHRMDLTPHPNTGFHPSAIFTTNGDELLAHFAPLDQVYCPKGPDYYMALSVSNWISTQVMQLELGGIQTELKFLMDYETVMGGTDVFGEGDLWGI